MYADAQQELGAAAWVGMMRPSSNAGIRVFRRTVGRDRGVETGGRCLLSGLDGPA